MPVIFCSIAVFCTLLVPVYPQTASENYPRTVIDQTTDPNQKLPSPAKPNGRPSVALVLSGGGARGFAHIPILELINEIGIPVDMIIGTSAGSIIAGLYCSGYSTEQLKTILLNLDWSTIFQDRTTAQTESWLGKNGRGSAPFAVKFGTNDGNFSLQMGTGILSGQYTYALFKKLTLRIPSDTDFDTLPIPFRAVTVDLLTGDIHVFTRGDVAESIRSSISIPTFFAPFNIGDEYFIDGGSRDNTPIDVAKKMGYDIIIVSEISGKLNDKIETFESNPLLAIRQMMSMEQTVKNVSEYYKQADLVMFPDYQRYSILDFKYAQQIYDVSRQSVEKYRLPLTQLKNRIDSETTSPVTSDRKIAFPASYADNPAVVPAVIQIQGTDDKDKHIIVRQFAGIANKKLSPESYDAFSNRIYQSGKYSSVVTRLTGPAAASTLNVIVRKKPAEKNVLLIGAEYAGAIASDSSNNFTVYTDFQFRNLSGNGSVFSIRASGLSDLGFGLMYMQPVGPITFIRADLSTKNSRNIISSGFDHYPITVTQEESQTAQIELGFPLTWWFTLTAGTSINKFNTSDEIDDGSKTSATDFFTEIAFNTLNHTSFPTSGFSLDLVSAGVIPMQDLETSRLYDLQEFQTAAAIPVSKKFSILFAAFGGGNFSEKLQDIPEQKPIYGFSLADRKFFPQIAPTTEYGLYEGVFEAGLQFEPWEQLTILGGEAFFAVTGAAGNVWNQRENIGADNLCWRSSFDIGIRITDGFGFLLRMGAGKSHDKTVPFISFDIGTVQL